jgi:leucyl-tRNA synthetase
VLVLSPIAPHVTQQLWQVLGEPGLLVQASWPVVDESALVQDTVELVLQVNGKVRGRLEVAHDISEAEAQQAALAHENVARTIGDKKVRKCILVPGKLVNLVVG